MDMGNFSGFPEEPEENPEKAKKSHRRPNFSTSGVHKKMQRQQVWADYFAEQAEKHKNMVPIQYNKWVSSLVAAGYFGDTLSQVRLREELTRLSKKAEKYVPNRPKERLKVAHSQLMGIGKGKDTEKAVTTYGALVEEFQLPEAQFALAMCYMDGIVVKQNEKLALEYLQKSMDQGYFLAKSQYTLAIFMGKGENRDLHFCFDSFLDMANEGCAFACTLVGIFYEFGIVVNRDPRMAEGYVQHGVNAGFSVDRFGEELRQVVEDLIFDYIDEYPPTGG